MSGPDSMMVPFLHSFVVPAYEFSPYLEQCLDSLRTQTVPSEILVSTSTPNQKLSALCQRMRAPLLVHGPSSSIASDWNQALKAARTKFVTLAHQDDVYYPDFTRRTLSALEKVVNPVLAFTNYDEFTAHGNRPINKLLLIKQLLLHMAFLGRKSVAGRFSKRNAIRFACPIPCPSVTFNTELYTMGFDSRFQINLDWAAWACAAEGRGAFVWIRESLMGHRIHESSETSAAIVDGRRLAEDRAILLKFWPEAIVNIVVKGYSVAYNSNDNHTNT